eukprot:1160425-Pelagomonas_calceolata.AAC.2
MLARAQTERGWVPIKDLLEEQEQGQPCMDYFNAAYCSGASLAMQGHNRLCPSFLLRGGSHPTCSFSCPCLQAMPEARTAWPTRESIQALCISDFEQVKQWLRQNERCASDLKHAKQ